MEALEMIEFLKQGSIRVVGSNQSVYTINHTSNDTVIYFWNSGYYSSFSNEPEGRNYNSLLEKLSTIIRIEKEMDSEYYPIWTKEDGIIQQGENFVRLKGRYYTVRFLEKLIDQIIDFKKINI